MRLSAGGAPVSITISIGVASLSEVGAEGPAEALLDLVDKRLGAAKRDGRNRVCVAGP
jgi:PleD family two-component response regulator